jgi:ankyrin repeat protein
MRSLREHNATLLHYTSANGVEGWRQRTPANAVDVARLLLDAGADVDAEADVYGGGCTTLGLTATSTPPAIAGVQLALLELLLERGAALDRPAGGRNLIVDCFMNGCPDAARYLESRGAPLNLEAAAATGHLEVVRRLLPQERERLQRAFLLACGYGQNDIAEFLLDSGADLLDEAGTSEPALHWAAMGGNAAGAKMLIARGAPLESLNGYGGTALGQAVWSFANSPNGVDYAPVMEALLDAGAKVKETTIAWLERESRKSREATARIVDLLRRRSAAT